MKSARSRPLLGLAFLISAITAAWPWLILARSAPSKSRVSTRLSASARPAARGTRFWAAATSARLAAMIWSRISFMVVGRGWVFQASACVRATNSSSLSSPAPHPITPPAPRPRAPRAPPRPPPRRYRFGHIGRVQRHAGVQADGVMCGPGLAPQHAEQHVARLLGRVDLERPVAGHGQPEVLGVDVVFADLAVLEFAHQRGCAQTGFVHAVTAVDDQHMLGAQALQRAHLYA